MSDIEWEDPPVSKAGRADGRSHKHEEIAAELKANPGKWAKTFTGVSPSYTSNIKNGLLKAYLPVGTFEAVSRNTYRNDDGLLRGDIYVRYIGNSKTEADR